LVAAAMDTVTDARLAMRSRRRRHRHRPQNLSPREQAAES
jgi:hypothetical protein